MRRPGGTMHPLSFFNLLSAYPRPWPPPSRDWAFILENIPPFPLHNAAF